MNIEKTSEPYVIMAKPVGARCNMQCVYCYYLKNEELHKGKSIGVMSDEALEAFIKSYIETSPGPYIQITWHGGEPTLAGLSFYKKAVEFEKKYLPEGWEIWNNIQTNGIFIDDDWCEFLKNEKFDVGLSIDGNKWLHDLNRVDKAGRGTFKKASQSAKRMTMHGLRPDILCTVTSQLAEKPLAVYQSLKSFKSGWMQFIPIVRRLEGNKLTDDSVTAEKYGEFLSAIFDEWATHDIGTVGIQIFAELSLMLKGSPSGVCQMAPVCGRVLVVESDGAVYSCDHFVDEGHQIGSIFESSLAEIADSAFQKNFGAAKKDTLPRKCLECQWLQFCNGGCPKDRVALIEGEEPINVLCEGYKIFFSHVVEPLSMILRALDREESIPRIKEIMKIELGMAKRS